MKYYHTVNASVPLNGFEFAPIGSFGGSLYGVYATDVEAQIAKLDVMVKAKPTPVTEITEAEYFALQKKTPPSSRLSISSDSLQNPLTATAKPAAASSAAPAAVVNPEPIVGKGASVLETPAAAVEVTPPSKPEELLQTGRGRKKHSANN